MESQIAPGWYWFTGGIDMAVGTPYKVDEPVQVTDGNMMWLHGWPFMVEMKRCRGEFMPLTKPMPDGAA